MIQNEFYGRCRKGSDNKNNNNNQSITSLPSAEIPIGTLPNNENQLFCEADEAPTLLPTANTSAQLYEDIHKNNSDDSLLSKNSQSENSSNSLPPDDNTGANDIQSTAQNSFETQLNDDHEKQKLLFNHRKQKSSRCQAA